MKIRQLSHGPTEYEDNNITIWENGGRIVGSWVNDGATTFPLTEEESKLTPESVVTLIQNEHQNGLFYRCSSCGTKLAKADVAGWPLFAGVACAPCWAKHQTHLNEQRQHGHVCRMCGHPYDDCCC